jgi:hypothetical protein
MDAFVLDVPQGHSVRIDRVDLPADSRLIGAHTSGFSTCVIGVATGGTRLELAHYDKSNTADDVFRALEWVNSFSDGQVELFYRPETWEMVFAQLRTQKHVPITSTTLQTLIYCLLFPKVIDEFYATEWIVSAAENLGTKTVHSHIQLKAWLMNTSNRARIRLTPIALKAQSVQALFHGKVVAMTSNASLKQQHDDVSSGCYTVSWSRHMQPFDEAAVSLVPHPQAERIDRRQKINLVLGDLTQRRSGALRIIQTTCIYKTYGPAAGWLRFPDAALRIEGDEDVSVVVDTSLTEEATSHESAFSWEYTRSLRRQANGGQLIDVDHLLRDVRACGPKQAAICECIARYIMFDYQATPCTSASVSAWMINAHIAANPLLLYVFPNPSVATATLLTKAMLELCHKKKTVLLRALCTCLLFYFIAQASLGVCAGWNLGRRLADRGD